MATALTLRISLILLGSAACMGKETGDEGQESERPSSEVVENTASEPEPMQEPEASGGPLPNPYCDLIEHFEDGSPRHSCHFGEPSLDFIMWQPGDATPSGPYSCQCGDGERVDLAAADDCNDALRTACNVDPTIEQCVDRASSIARCEADVEGDGYRCRCAPEDPVVAVDASSCEEAVFSQCGAPSCGDSWGTCLRLEQRVGYACDCSDGTQATWPGAFECGAALSQCAPACEATRGRCSERREGFDCLCAATPETAATFVSNDEAYGICLLAVESVCGPPPAGESCEEGDEHAMVVCTADGDGGWECTCDHVEPEPPPSPAPADDVPDVPSTSFGRAEQGGAGVAPHPPPPDDVAARHFACWDAIWSACE
jgi:hypothetical protein